VGTRALPDGAWLMRDELAASEIALRRRLLSEQRDHVFACSARADVAASEVAGLIDRWSASQPELGLAACDETHPLARAGGLVQEDLCLMVESRSRWRLEGAVLCFPSQWILSEKMGHPLDLIHEPVPRYAEELAARVDRFIDRLSPAKPVWRRNFSLWPACLLWAPVHALDPSLHEVTGGGAPALWLRSERQTMRRLPDSGAILFTIRVQMAPVSVLAQRPGRARDLAHWLESSSGAVRLRQTGPQADALLRWLAEVAGPG
jgi:dimethylamine monooxygenase subunit A